MSPKDLFSLTDTFPILSCTRCAQPSVSLSSRTKWRGAQVLFLMKHSLRVTLSHSHLCQSTPSEDIFVPRFIWVILVWQDLHRVASKCIQFNHVVLTKIFTWVKLKWDSSLAHPEYSVYNFHWRLEGSCKSRSNLLGFVFRVAYVNGRNSTCFTQPCEHLSACWILDE